MIRSIVAVVAGCIVWSVAFPLLAFAVDDLASAVERLHAHGVELPWGVEEGAESQWAIFRDPAGNLVELVEFGGR